MFRLFDMLGQSTAMRALDDALRASGVHPALVPEPVKLTIIQLHKKQPAHGGQNNGFAESAHLLAFCMLGHDQFRESTSAYDAAHVDHRIEAAFEDGDSLDAKLILLTLHAGLISPEVADRIDLEEPGMHDPE